MLYWNKKHRPKKSTSSSRAVVLSDSAEYSTIKAERFVSCWRSQTGRDWAQGRWKTGQGLCWWNLGSQMFVCLPKIWIFKKSLAISRNRCQFPTADVCLMWREVRSSSQDYSVLELMGRWSSSDSWQSVSTFYLMGLSSPFLWLNLPFFISLLRVFFAILFELKNSNQTWRWRWRSI